MSQHILQQFDESLLLEITEMGRAADDVAICDALIKRRENRLISQGTKRPTAREWCLMIIAMAAVFGSLFYSISVTRRLEEVQNRLVRLESASSQPGR